MSMCTVVGMFLAVKGRTDCLKNEHKAVLKVHRDKQKMKMIPNNAMGNTKAAYGECWISCRWNGASITQNRTEKEHI